MTDAEKIKAEVERRIEEVADVTALILEQIMQKAAQLKQLLELRRFIDTMFQEVDAIKVREMASGGWSEEYKKGYGDAMRYYFNQMKDKDFEAFLCQVIKQWQKSGDDPELEEFEGYLSCDAAKLFDIARRKLEVIEKPAEWSEDDENHVKSILSTIECCKAQFPNAQAVVEAYNADINWLKSLRPQNR